MDSPSAPTPPDPTVVANAQGAANNSAARINTSLNRADQYTPYGSLTWTQPGRTFDQAGYDAAMAAFNAPQTSGPAVTAPGGGSGYGGGSVGSGLTEVNAENMGSSGGPGGVTAGAPAARVAPNREDFYSGDQDRWESHMNLDPRVQALLDSNLATSQGLETSIQSALGRVNDTLGTGINYGALPAAGDAAGALKDAMARFTSFKPQIEGQKALATGGQQMLGAQMQRFNEMLGTALPTADAATRKKVEDALFAKATSRLDPRFAADEASMRSTLMNRGIVEGSEAWNNELANFNRSKNDATSNALWDSISKGGDEMQKLLGMELAVRDQGQEETMSAGRLSSGINTDLSNFLGQETAQQQAVQSVAGQQFNMQNTQRQNSLGEQERKRALVLNELAALRGGAQVQMPQFGATPSGATVIPAPYAQSAYNTFTGQQNQYNAEVGSNNATTGAGMGAIASIAAAFI